MLYCGNIRSSAVYIPGPGLGTPKYLRNATMASSASSTMKNLYCFSCCCRSAAVGTSNRYKKHHRTAAYTVKQTRRYRRIVYIIPIKRGQCQGFASGHEEQIHCQQATGIYCINTVDGRQCCGKQADMFSDKKDMRDQRKQQGDIVGNSQKQNTFDCYFGFAGQKQRISQ